MFNIIGDWGLGIVDWAQSPIPNPQSPFGFIELNMNIYLENYCKLINKYVQIINNYT